MLFWLVVVLGVLCVCLPDLLRYDDTWLIIFVTYFFCLVCVTIK